MAIFKRLILWLSSLKVAIVLLLIIAISSAIGTGLPQNESPEKYLELFDEKPWLGLLNGSRILFLQFDHVYESSWFLFLLTWLALALIICSWRRQWPSLKAALVWIDYKEPSQLRKLSIAEKIDLKNRELQIDNLAIHLERKGWEVKTNNNRLAARKGILGRTGPPLIHIGLVLLMVGAVWGNFEGQKVERFLLPGSSLSLNDQKGTETLMLNLKSFEIERDPSGRPEQFRSKIELQEKSINNSRIEEISVNHPLRYNGITIYQADWELASITLQIGKSPKLQLPLSSLPQLGDQIWGLVLPTDLNGEESVLITVSNEEGPVNIYNEKGTFLASLRPGGEGKEIKGIPLSVKEVLAASGLLIKQDPGVPIVYTAFTITLIGSGLSIISTKQIWAIIDKNKSAIYYGGLCNRNLSGFSSELPNLMQSA